MKALHLTHIFFLYTATKRFFHFWAHIIFIAACTIFVFTEDFPFFNESWLNQFINLTRASITFFVECYYTCTLETKTFLQSEMRHLYGKNAPPKWDSGFMNVGSMLGWRICFHINRFWLFNRILLSGEISLNRGPLFTAMFFLHISTPPKST